MRKPIEYGLNGNPTFHPTSGYESSSSTILHRTHRTSLPLSFSQSLGGGLTMDFKMKFNGLIPDTPVSQVRSFQPPDFPE